MSWYRKLLWRLLWWREVRRLDREARNIEKNAKAYRRRLLVVDEPANPWVDLSCPRCGEPSCGGPASCMEAK
jgi:hypothetical protein